MSDPQLPKMLIFLNSAEVSVRPAAAAATITSSSIDTDFDRDDVIDALSMAASTDDPNSAPSRERTLLDLMGDPRCAGETLPMLMKRSGLILHEMLELLRRRNTAMAMMKSARHMGDVVDGLGEFGKPGWSICTGCKGEGTITGAGGDGPGDGDDAVMECPNPECKDGKVRRMGNLDAAKLFLEVHGLRKGSGGAGTTVNVGGAQIGVRIDNDKSAKQESITSRVQGILEG